ncbi:hypothetical protein BDD14_0861 [Edaphobacter modestus]|uniref:Molybdopterin-dependent oxidoreductase-like protein n=2 Tax=Edaphobacter modestus TaxID=388466 RepID=A0A4V2G433_9BACT|nr:hypothetical protein BDD14_0861 [Edaphobacter modestus]
MLHGPKTTLPLARRCNACRDPPFGQPDDGGTCPRQGCSSTQLQITVDGKTSTVTLTELAAMPQKTVKVHNEHTKKDEAYTGVALSDLLARSGFAVGQPTHRKMLHSYLVAEGTDKYWVLYSATEIEGSEHEADVLVATAVDGGSLGEDGQLKLVASADKKPQRWVRNLSAIRLVTVSE